MTATTGQARLLDELAALVECESPSADTAATTACAKVLDDIVADRLGVRAEFHDVDGHTHLRWSFGRPRVLLIGHLDTVWPTDTTQRWPFTIDADRATGPGVFDMKGGLVQLFAALSELADLDGIAALVTSDEEIGSTTSRALIEETAAGVDAVLVLEPSLDGALKTARKGVGMYTIEITGRAAHAGLEPERGVNATLEAAYQAINAAALARPELGTTVTPTVISGGTTVNTIPAAARFAVDIRANTVEEMRRVDRALTSAAPCLTGAGLRVRSLGLRLPFEPAMSRDLFAAACRLAEQLGIERLAGAAVGGGSDGNITAALGVPTLDGLGAVGDGAHAEGEWISVPHMSERSSLVAALVRDVLGKESEHD